MAWRDCGHSTASLCVGIDLSVVSARGDETCSYEVSTFLRRVARGGVDFAGGYGRLWRPRHPGAPALGVAGSVPPEATMPRRSKTPGVRIVQRKRADGVTYYGRWQDQITGEWKDENLTRAGLTTDGLRRRWLQKKSDELYAARRAFTLGEVHTTPEQAAKRYLDDCRKRLRRRTVVSYEFALGLITEHLMKAGHVATQATTPGDLWALRGALIQREIDRSTLNNYLARARAAFEWWRRAQLVPLLTSDMIRDAFRGLPLDRDEIHPLLPAEIRDLLRAAVKAPDARASAHLALILLTGMRRGEVDATAWEDVRLTGPHPSIQLGTWTKTRRARTIDLSVSPAAVSILKALPKRGAYILSEDEPLSRSTARDWCAALQVLPRPWTFRLLRQTAGSYMANAAGLWGGASAYRTAKQLGHSVAVSERHYLGVLRGIPPAANTVEAAMEASEAFSLVTDRLGSRTDSEVGRGDSL